MLARIKSLPFASIVVFSSVFFMFPSPSAWAEHTADAAGAEALFEAGRRLMTAGDFAAACPKLAESQRLDPAAGTLLNLAVCYERGGKTATAWATYKSAGLAAQQAGETDRARAATRKASDLEAKLSRITFTVPASRPPPGLEVRCDGQPIREPSWGVPLPYDPGNHEVEASAPGRRRWVSHVPISGDGQQLVITIPALEASPADPGLLPPPRGANDGDATPRQRDGATQRIAGGILGGIGVVGLAVGIYTGLEAKSVYGDALAQCGGGTICPSGQGIATRDQATSWATASTIAFIGGGAALAGGLVLFFTAPRDRTTLSVGPSARGTGLSLTGQF
jgi:hypothetical protein